MFSQQDVSNFISSLPPLHAKFPTGYAGSLQKRGHWRTNWKERYFTLIPELKSLKYFANSGQTHLKGEMMLDHECSVMEYQKEELENHCHVFVVKGKINNECVTYYMSADNRKTMRNWIQAIEETVHDGFPLISLPDLWSESFHCTSHVICTFDNLDGNLVRRPSDHFVDLAQLRRQPFVSFTKSMRSALENREVRAVSSSDRIDHPRKHYDYFTIVMFDLSLPPNGYLCWLIMNVKDQDMYTGVEVIPYSSPAPVYGKIHQLYFVVFQQTDHFLYTQLDAFKSLFADRYNFTLEKLADNCSFFSLSFKGLTINPIGIARYVTTWDVNCDELHQRMGYHPPKANMSSFQLLELRKYCYHRYKLSQGFYYLRSLDQLKQWQPISIAFRPNQRQIRRLEDKSAWLPHSIDSQDSPTAHNSKKIDNSVHVFDGDVIYHDTIDREPYVTFPISDVPAVSTVFHMLAMICLDYPTRTAPLRDQKFSLGFLQWLVGNIPNNNIAGGEEIAPYMAYADPTPSNTGNGPSQATYSDPPFNSPRGDYYRHVLVVFAQSRRLTIEDVTSRVTISRYNMKFFPALEELGVKSEPVAFASFITKTNSFANPDTKNQGEGVETNFIIPPDIDWIVGSHRPQNQRTSLNDGGALIDRLSSGPVLVDVDDIIDDEEYAAYTSPNAITKTETQQSGGGPAVHETLSDLEYLFRGIEGMTDEEKVYQRKFIVGEVVRKKFSSDYVSKKRFVWIDPAKQTLNWGKSAADKSDPFKHKYMGLQHKDVVDVHMTPSKAIRISFATGSSVDLEIAANETEDLSIKRIAFLKLVHRVRHLKHTEESAH